MSDRGALTKCPLMVAMDILNGGQLVPPLVIVESLYGIVVQKVKPNVEVLTTYYLGDNDKFVLNCILVVSDLSYHFYPRIFI